MAIQVALTAAQTNVGIACTSAYARIVMFDYDNRTGRVDVRVDVWADRNARDAHKVPVFGGVYSGKWFSNEVTGDQARGEVADPAVAALPAIGAVNLPSLYTFLHTVPDFSAGADV